VEYYNKDFENFWKILQKKVLLTVSLLLLIRMGSFFPVPGIDFIELGKYFQDHPSAQNFVSTFSGDDTFVIGLFSLNIIPYINASILLQLLIGTGLSPSLAELQKEGNMASRRVIEKRTRLLSLIFGIGQSLLIAFLLKPILFNWNLNLTFEIVIWLTTGSMIVIWLSQIITDYGIGNGPSLLVFINIISSFPNLYKKIISANIGTLSFQSISLIIGLIFILLYGSIGLQESYQKIRLISSKELNQPSQKFLRKPETFLPLNLNQAGVIPLIFTTALLVIPIYLVNLGIFSFVKIPSILVEGNNPSLIKLIPSLFYWYFYFILIIKSSAFYSTLVLKPKDISEQLQKMAVIIPNIRPGRETTFYLKEQIRLTSKLGAILLGLLATLPNLVEKIFNISNLSGLSTTSLLIVAGVLLDILREISSIYYLTIYNKM
jgi:preprotein translocase subunit SecY